MTASEYLTQYTEALLLETEDELYYLIDDDAGICIAEGTLDEVENFRNGLVFAADVLTDWIGGHKRIDFK